MRLLKALSAFVVLGALVVGPPWLLSRYVGNPWPSGGVSIGAPLTDEAIVGLLAVVVWLLWAQFVCCVLAEAIAALTDDRLAPPFTMAFGFQRHLARRLVATVVIATVSTPLLTGAGAAAVTFPTHSKTLTEDQQSSAWTVGPPGSAVVGRDAPDHPRREVEVTLSDAADAAPSSGAHTTSAAAHRQHAPVESRSPQAQGGIGALEQQTATEAVTVMRLDTLWSIAERTLGSGERWPEIAALNEGRTMADGVRFTTADHIRPGWRLLVPASATTVDRVERTQTVRRGNDVSPTHPRRTPQARGGTGQVTVSRGDSLWEIAEDTMGGGQEWPRLYQHNRATIGADPDLIYPGEVLRLPAPGPPEPVASELPDSVEARGSGADDRRTRVAPLSTPRGPGSTGTPHRPHVEASDAATPVASPTPRHGADHAEAHRVVDITALRALLATAILLSSALAAALLANRRHQMRHRRPGRRIVDPPRGPAHLERMVGETADRATADFVDLALRDLAAHHRASQKPIPALDAAVLDDAGILLLFAGDPDGAPPPGWAQSDGGWRLPANADLAPELRNAQPAPYPALVSIGLDDNGRTWLLDLEQQGDLRLGGAPANDLMRFMVAELALNTWSADITVLLVDNTLPELSSLDPRRVRRVTAADAHRQATAHARESDSGATALRRRRDDLAVESTSPLVIVTDGAPAELDRGGDDRPAVLVLCTPVGAAVEVRDHGLRLPGREFEVRPFLLTDDQARLMCQLLALTRQPGDVAVPPAPEDTALGQLTKVDGSVREDLTARRDQDVAGTTTLLPDPDDTYLQHAATTPTDIASLAPSVPEPVRADLLLADPDLEQDLIDWFDARSIRPRVRVLGPVDVTALDGEHERVANLGGTVEFVVYLACQERGVTKDRAAEDLGWSGATVQNRARDARRVLGRRPDGAEWLPDAGRSDSARRRGVATYQLDPEVLVDADLFRRLRARAAAHGAGGLKDLVTALALVHGEPFEQLRRGGYGWLLEGDRLDHHLAAAIADVAHIVATRALVDDDLDLARRACQIGIRVNPHSDIARLDLAAVVAAEGGDPDDVLRSEVLERVDADLTARTEEVLRRRGWLAS